MNVDHASFLTAWRAAAAHERQAAKIHKLTMGELVGKFSDDVLGGSGAAGEPSVEIDEAWYSFRFKVSADSAFMDQQNTAMANVVNERNELIHHFLAKWNPASQESTLAIIARLDAQRDKGVMSTGPACNMRATPML